MISYYKYGNGKLTICEDSFTASVFDLLKYLPTDLFWHILKKSLLVDNLPSHCGEILIIDFWPKWSAENTSNARYVEPDLFLRFQDFDLIIEAKRYDLNQQKPFQLKDEITSYYNEYKTDDKKLYLLQLGGLDLKDKSSITTEYPNVLHAKTTWSKLLNSINMVYKNITKQSLPSQKPLELIFIDLINVFAAHGFHNKKWLKKTINYTINNTSMNNFKF